MHGMTAPLSAGEMALRLGLTVLVGLVIGYDRGEHGKAAGLRTTSLVCLAASISMIQVNLLLPTAGRAPDSFVMNDLMRLPLGILTGVGFIGAGAILRRDNLVVGVTTAASLWLVTVLGLCIGGGQIALGISGTVIGFAVLWGLRWAEAHLKRERHSRLTIALADGHHGSETAIRRRLEQDGIRIAQARVALTPSAGRRELEFDLRDVCYPSMTEMPPAIRELADEPGVVKLAWSMRQ